MPKYAIMEVSTNKKGQKLMSKYIKTIKCKECGATLTNLAEFYCDEGFLCSDCGIEYNHHGKEI